MPPPPSVLKDHIDECYYRFGLLSGQILSLHTRFHDLADLIAGQHWSSAAFVLNGIADVFTQVDVNLSRTLPSVRCHLDDALNYINTNTPWDAEPLTWQAICEAWVSNDFEGRTWTIGIIDRMRQILWDEPFNLTWAARPEQEGL